LQGQATLKSADDRAQFQDLAKLLELDIHMEQETIADSDKEEDEKETEKPTPEKIRGRQNKKKGGSRPAKPAAGAVEAEPEAEKGGADAAKTVAKTGADLAKKKVALLPPPSDNSSVESISEILKAAPRVR